MFAIENEEITHRELIGKFLIATMRASLTVGGKRKFSRVSSHQRLEAARRDDFAKRSVDGFGAGADAETLRASSAKRVSMPMDVSLAGIVVPSGT